MQNLLQEILSDNHSGSLTLAYKELDLYETIVAEAQKTQSDLEKLHNKIHDTGKIIIKAQPNMVILRRVSNHLQNHYKRLVKAEKPGSEIYSALLEKIEQIRREFKQNVGKIAQMGAKVIATSNKVMTISNSTLVREIFCKTHAQKRRFEVFNLKSHPPDEGILFAEDLAEKGIRSTVIADSQMGVFLPEMNLVFVGADRIFENGFINKAGTLPLCLAARHYNVPVYLAVETIKILTTRERSIKVQNMNPDEVYRPKNDKISVENSYFESIPLDLVHKVICEDGVFETFEFVNWYLKE